MEKQQANALMKLVDWMIERNLPNVEAYVTELRRKNPGMSDKRLARRIVRRKSFKNGLVGAATGLGGLITLPVAVPADILMSWRIQIFMILAVASVHGLTKDNADLRTDIFLVMAGNAAKDVLKKLGIETSKAVTRRAVQKHVTKEIMKKIWKVVPQKIITKAGEKSLTSFTKMVPLVGAPIGFAFDLGSCLVAGKLSIAYYGGGG